MGNALVIVKKRTYSRYQNVSRIPQTKETATNLLSPPFKFLDIPSIYSYILEFRVQTPESFPETTNFCTEVAAELTHASGSTKKW